MTDKQYTPSVSVSGILQYVYYKVDKRIVIIQNGDASMPEMNISNA